MYLLAGRQARVWGRLKGGPLEEFRRAPNPPSSVYDIDMGKKRVNITLDSAVHDEMRRFLDVVGEDFSSLVEQMCLSFLGQMRPLIRRIGEGPVSEAGLTPSEMRVMFLQMMGGVQVEAGVQLNDILKELDIVEAEQQKKAAPLFEEPKPIHTPKVTKGTKSKK